MWRQRKRGIHADAPSWSKPSDMSKQVITWAQNNCPIIPGSRGIIAELPVWVGHDVGITKILQMVRAPLKINKQIPVHVTNRKVVQIGQCVAHQTLAALPPFADIFADCGCIISNAWTITALTG